MVCASTGNHGVAAAAYAARAGLQCAVLTHEEAPAAHVEAIRQFGATPVAVPPMYVTTCCADWSTLAGTRVRPSGLARVQTLRRRGLQDHRLRDCRAIGARGGGAAHVFVPVGGGDSLYGIYKGFAEQVALGVLERLPRVYACQPAGAAPLVAAEASGADQVPHVEIDRSLALSIREADTGNHALRGLRDSAGVAVAVTDTEIMDAASRLGRLGLAVDPASAASVAGALALVHGGRLADDGPRGLRLDFVGRALAAAAGLAARGAQLAASSAEQAYRRSKRSASDRVPGRPGDDVAGLQDQAHLAQGADVR